MPGELWKHWCTKHNGLVREGAKIRCDCGAPHEYDGWHLSMYEAMGAYQKLYGLRAVGPHRRMTDQLFADATFACPLCDGRGLLAAKVGEGCSTCRLCDGMRHLVALSAEEFQARRREVLAVYPDAAVPLA